MSPKSFLKSLTPTASKPDKKDIKSALMALVDPLSKTPLLEANLISDITITDQRITIMMTVQKEQAQIYEPLCADIEAALSHSPATKGFKSRVILTDHIPHQNAQQNPIDPLSRIQNIIAVGSGKGGVGKSTTTINLAYALKTQGHRVGILDADIYGPSLPKMIGLHNAPKNTDDGFMVPIEKDGLKIMSMGFLVKEDTPVIWRGPMVQKAIQQFVGKVQWGTLDFLLIDLPPGTGDIQLTLIRKASITGAIIVSTPQDMALIDAKKAIGMFQKVDIPILGVIENMSVFTCPHCQEQSSIFSHGGAKHIAQDLGVPCLAEVPLALGIREKTDHGGHEQLTQDEHLGTPYHQAAKTLTGLLLPST